MAEVLHWRKSAAPREVLARAVETLAGGRLVAFPTETGYGVAANALHAGAVEALHDLTNVNNGQPLAVAVAGAAEAQDWLPGLSPLGRRLARRCWPGPVAIVAAGGEDGLASRLPETVRGRVCPEGRLALCSPPHQALLQALHRTPVPVVMADVGANGGTAADTWHGVADAVSLVVHDRPVRPGPQATVVAVNGSSWAVVRDGAVPREALAQLSCTMVVFVCTGNTCRSPLAEVLFQKALAEQLGCRPEDLPGRGFVVLSAGLAAMMGGRAAPEAVEVARQLGADLTRHQSRPLTEDLAAQADHLFVMTRSHLFALAEAFPRLAARPRLLAPHGDVPDPIGSAEDVYQECARIIAQHVERLLPEVVQS